MPRSAFLEGARVAGGTKTCTGATAKQKTAVPKGAASLSLAVLESDGKKREVATDNEARSEEERGVKTPRDPETPALSLAGDGRVHTVGQYLLGPPIPAWVHWLR